MIDPSTQDFVTCVDLTNKQFVEETNPPSKPKDVYHGIYASQLYDTLFAIYGKFDTDEKTKAGFCLVNGLDLKLLNYKGVINIGFPAQRISVNPNEEKQIDFSVQGGITNYEMRIDFEEPVEIKQPGFKSLIFSRTLLPLPQFGVDPSKQDDLSSLKEKKNTPIPISPFFDTEFNYRDGIDHFDQILRPGMAGLSDKESILSLMIFSFRCIQSKVNIVYY